MITTTKAVAKGFPPFFSRAFSRQKSTKKFAKINPGPRVLSVASYDMTRSQDLDYNRDYVPSQRNHANKPRNRGQRAQTNPETVKIKIISMTTSKPRRHRTPVPPSHSAGCQKNKEACTLPSPRSPEERAGSHRGAQRNHDFGIPVSFGGEKKLIQYSKKKKINKRSKRQKKRAKTRKGNQKSPSPGPPFGPSPLSPRTAPV